jgi:transposase
MDTNQLLFAMALGIQEPWYIGDIKFDTQQQRLDLYIQYKGGIAFPCAECGEMSKVRDSKEKVWRHLDFFQHECYLHAQVPRINCRKHGIRQVVVPWASPRSGFTILFESFAMILVQQMTVNAAARILRIFDTRLWRIIQKHVTKARAKEDYSTVKQIGIDETSVKKKHTYVTFVVDLARNKLLFGTEGNASTVVKAFATELTDHNSNPEAITDVCCDLWRGYEKGVGEYLENAAITYDRFHFIKKINVAVDEVRKSEGKEKKELKGSRFLFLKNPANLTPEQAERLKPLCTETTKTGKAYSLKVSLLDVYRCPGYDVALAFLHKWADWAQRSKLKPFIQLSKSVRRNAKMIAHWHITHITNGILEGFNSLIQAAKNKARGYRNPKNFIAIAYLLTGKLNFGLHTN